MHYPIFNRSKSLTQGTRERFLSRRKPENVRKLVESQLEKGRPVALGTHGLKKIDRLVLAGITPVHAYRVEAVTQNGVKLKLGNPWGYGEPVGDGVDDGVFEVSIDTLAQCFDVLYIC